MSRKTATFSMSEETYDRLKAHFPENTGSEANIIALLDALESEHADSEELNQLRAANQELTSKVATLEQTNQSLNQSLHTQTGELEERDKEIGVDSRAYEYTPASAITDSTTFTLVCGDVTDAGVATTRTKTTTLSFLYKLYYNTVTGNTPSTQTEIAALGKSGDTSSIHWSNSKTITHAFKGQKFCIALPSSMSITKAMTSNNENITTSFTVSDDIDYAIGNTTTKYKVHTFEVAAEMDVTLTITIA